MLQQIKILPLIGIDGLPLGVEMPDVVGAIGEPDTRSKEEFIDENPDEVWEFYELGFALTFFSDDNWLLGTICVETEDAELAGRCFIGLTEKEFLDNVKQTDIAPVELDDNFENLGSKNYVSEKKRLSFWVQDGKIVSITIFPEYEKSSDAFMWPVDAISKLRQTKK